MKYVLVTGASSGIGKTTAIGLAKKGYYIFAGVRNARDAETLDQLSPGIHPVILDVTNNSDIDMMVEKLKVCCGQDGLYALVNNAGINYIEPFENSREEAVRRLMETNFFGLYRLTQRLLPLLQTAAQKTPAKIVNVSSVGGVLGLPWQSFYHASKFAVVGFSESLRQELRPANIVVCCVLPGGIKTPFFSKSEDEIQQSIERLGPANAMYYAKGLGKMKDAARSFIRFASKPERVSTAIEHILSLHRPRFKWIVGTDASVLYWMTKIVPSGVRHRMLQNQFGV